MRRGWHTPLHPTAVSAQRHPKAETSPLPHSFCLYFIGNQCQCTCQCVNEQASSRVVPSLFASLPCFLLSFLPFASILSDSVRSRVRVGVRVPLSLSLTGTLSVSHCHCHCPAMPMSIPMSMPRASTSVEYGTWMHSTCTCVVRMHAYGNTYWANCCRRQQHQWQY